MTRCIVGGLSAVRHIQNYIQYVHLPYSFSQFHGVVDQISSQLHTFGQQYCYTNVN